MQKRQQEIQDYMTKLKKDADVQILDEKLKPQAAEGINALPPGHPGVQPAKKPEPKWFTRTRVSAAFKSILRRAFGCGFGNHQDPRYSGQHL